MIQLLKSAPDLKAVSIMMVSNDTDHQQRAADAGAEWGFGKTQLEDRATLKRLGRFL